ERGAGRPRRDRAGLPGRAQPATDPRRPGASDDPNGGGGMIWLTWRQHRMQALAALVGLGAVGAFFLATGPSMAHLFKSSGLAQCLSVLGSDCRDLSESFTERYHNLQ